MAIKANQSAQNSSGIQTLLEAERKAHEIVQHARAYRTQRLKAAKTDAAQEVEEYKQKKEQEFRASESKNTGQSSEIKTKAEAEVVEELKTIKADTSKKRDEVINYLLEAVTTAHPTLHINAA